MIKKPLSNLAVDSSEVTGAISEELPYRLLADNFSDVSDAKMIGAREAIYRSRRVNFNPINLMRLDVGATLLGGRHFILKSGDFLVEEQIPPPNIIENETTLASLIEEPKEQILISKPSVLVARYGLMTWGHWIGQLLPRILLTERTWPQRFSYVLPVDIFNGSAPRNVWNSILDTIRMCDISDDRIIAVSYNKNYTFSQLFCMNSVITDGAFHPYCLDMLAKFPSSDFSGKSEKGRRIALLRTESKRRNIINLPQVVALLKRYDFEFIEIGKLPVREQVHLFSSAEVIVGVLASELAGIFFSRNCIKVLSLAPAGYKNGFYYPILQHKNALYIDMRGVIPPDENPENTYSNFEIDTKKMDELLASLVITPSASLVPLRSQIDLFADNDRLQALEHINSSYPDVSSSNFTFSTPITMDVFGKTQSNSRPKHCFVLELSGGDRSQVATLTRAGRQVYRHYTIFGFSEHKGCANKLLFSKNVADFRHGGIGSSMIDLKASKFSFLDKIMSHDEKAGVNTTRSVKDIDLIVDNLEHEATDADKITAGAYYWIEMMRGYTEFIRTGTLDIKNSYIKSLAMALDRFDFDPNLKVAIAHPDAMVERVRRRFDDITRLSEANYDGSGMEPIVIMDGNTKSGLYSIVHKELNITVFSDLIDGYHRIFWSNFFGVPQLPAVYILSSAR